MSASLLRKGNADPIHTLPVEAARAGFEIERVTEPDVFGWTRVHASGPAGTLTLVFNAAGNLDGGYLRGAGGKSWHTTQVIDVKRWLMTWGQGWAA